MAAVIRSARMNFRYINQGDPLPPQTVASINDADGNWDAGKYLLALNPCAFRIRIGCIPIDSDRGWMTACRRFQNMKGRTG